MNKVLYIHLFILLNLSLFAQHQEIDLLRTKAESKYIDYQAKQYLKVKSVDGFTFIIANKGTIVYAKSFGYADKVKKIPLTLNHRFPMMGATKLITATLAIQLLEKNIITLEDRVVGPKSIFEKEIPKASDPINLLRVRHLLEESSYISGETEIEDKAHSLAEAVLDYTYKYIPGDSPGFRPYCYYILGAILELKTNKKYRDLVKELTKDIFKNDLSFHGDQNLNGLVVSPVKPKDKLKVVDAHNGLVCSPMDMMNFILSIDGYGAVKDILTPIGIRILKSPHKKYQQYGKAWEIDKDGYFLESKTYGRQSTFILRNNFDGLSWFISINGSRFPSEFIKKVFNRVKRFP
ncbi:MAG: beta-lactamase family protein [Lentisphaeraceae bacterium]|nr:beta-lactamase family protein [Lentisphaeraceae bacterium]